MMKFRATLKTSIRAVKLAVAPFGCWPLPADAKPSDIWWLNIRWWFIFVHLQLCCVGIVWDIYMKRNNFDAVMTNASEVVAVSASIWKLIICKVDAPRLQRLLAEVEMFLKRATKEEMETIQFYVDKCYVLHLLCYILFLFGAILHIAAPVVIPQSLPADIDLPFSTEPFWIWLIVYISESFAVLEISSLMVVAYMYAILLWFVVARFEINCREFRRATTADDLRRCISKHQQLIEYTDQVRRITRMMVLHVVCGTLTSASIGGFILTRVILSFEVSEEKAVVGTRLCIASNKLPVIDVLKYIQYYLCSTGQFFMFAWPADKLIDMSVKIGDSAYNSAWVGKTIMLKDIILIVRKTQFPIEIAYDGLLPAVSLSLFRVCMTATFSYLATLRAMADG